MDTKNLILIANDQLKGEIANTPQLSAFAQNGASESFQQLLARVNDRTFDARGNKYLYALIIIKAEEEASIGVQNSKLILDLYLNLCEALNFNVSDLFLHISSILTREIMNLEQLEDIFEMGKQVLTLKAKGADVSILESSLDISFSPGIFEQSLDTSKEGILKGLSYLIKSKLLNLDTTGALQAIVGNALSWVETTNDFFGMNQVLGQQINPDVEGTKKINGLLSQIEIDDADFIQRKNVLAEKYGVSAVENLYQNVYEEEKVGENFSERVKAEEIKDINLLTIERDCFKQSVNQSKTISTLLYRGVIKSTGVQIAVKKIVATGNISDLEKFEKEVQIMREFSGKGECFLKFYGSFKVENALYILMDYVGDNLMDRLVNANGFEEIVQIEIAKKLISGFSYMATKRVYHRDIKPHNILITPENVPKIIDFGITVFETNPDKTTSAQTNKKFIQGTEGYMSIEQRQAYDNHHKGNAINKYNLQKSDVYSLGLTFFQMATKFEVSKYEKAENHELLVKEIGSIASEKMKNLLRRMLKLNPDERPTFSELNSEFGGVTVTVIN
ncbi:hypothetical protein SteCoe_10560 [Stentor coeruleus]|uniref:Protein kinase domain-containing protein n=1 Tax=Stentor coeruleus TaxID=5963 RepID=A0A1R2CFH9_9CILI|nr:hypothetical protein SteCoe_10560 [Stentor coeruleus]